MIPRIRVRHSLCVSLLTAALFVPDMHPMAAADPESGSTAADLVKSSRVLVIAHRGDSKAYPENTLPAFESAVKIGSDLVELDYVHTADGVLLVLHDKTLDRTTNAGELWGGRDILVKKKRLDDLRELDAGSWFDARFCDVRLPTLEESLSVIQTGSVTLIERKAGDAATCVTLLEEKGLLEQVVVQSFDWNFIRDCRRLAPNLTLAALGYDPIREEHLEKISQLGVQAIGWDHKQMNADWIEAIHQRGLRAWVYTVDDMTRVQQLIDAGIDGIITNVPAETKKVVGAGS